ncbi:MAG: PAS domain-containing protein, partial [Pseudolabrys sp.]|nr:PAS domain-containing protein [Pseudolabrys sp.]
HPADRDEVVNNFRKAMATGQDLYEAEYRIVRPDGEIRWIFGRGRVFRDKDGVPQRYSGVDIDITARKKYEEHLAFTTRELSHRTKNILAVVQAMIRQISQRAKNLPEFEERLYGCISALAHSHDLLVASDWQGADLRGLLELQLTPFGAAEQELDAARFHIDGPDASLAPQAAQLIGLALHELATNAAKHGALSVQKGVVDVTWSDDGKGGINLVWRERGGPKVTPPKATGFGHVVLKRMAASLDATVSLEFPPDGVVWTMPIDAKYLVRA